MLKVLRLITAGFKCRHFYSYSSKKNILKCVFFFFAVAQVNELAAVLLPASSRGVCVKTAGPFFGGDSGPESCSCFFCLRLSTRTFPLPLWMLLEAALPADLTSCSLFLPF